MSTFRPYLVLVQPPAVECNVVPIRRSPTHGTMARARADGTYARETSWRDLVRRLTKSLARR
ncbi:MAG TPA: hypothetical protein VE820_04375 [Sphingomicrobium sp.]|nr:hypothetical protein [Sphingomicrobium sp.]